jgi:hypothetical protein
MNDYFDTLADDEKPVFSAVAEFAFNLGYKAKRDKSKTLSYTFKHRSIKKHILRFSSAKGKPIIKLKFFASPSYSELFREAIRTVIEEYTFQYTGCYGCGDCNGTQGYMYKYPDGREYYRCGKELIDLMDITKIPVPEMLELFKKQHDFHLSDQSSKTTNKS